MGLFLLSVVLVIFFRIGEIAALFLKCLFIKYVRCCSSIDFIVYIIRFLICFKKRFLKVLILFFVFSGF